MHNKKFLGLSRFGAYAALLEVARGYLPSKDPRIVAFPFAPSMREID